MPDLMTLIAATEEGQIVPKALFLDDYGWVAAAMAILLLVMIWKKVPGILVGGLDARIAEIKQQLDDAKVLRAEAEALRDEYAAKIASAEKDAEAMMANARAEADAILEKAESDSEKMVERRERMAEDKIAAAEREAVNSVRARAAEAAAQASRSLIAERHDKAADSKLADEVISSL
jgi:F-type H+-transporting ATPase subunit b